MESKSSTIGKLLFYLTIQGIVKYCKCEYDKNVVFFASFFQIISKTIETILMKKIERNHGVLVYSDTNIIL